MHTNLNVAAAWALATVDAIAAACAQAGLSEREVAALVLLGSHPGAGVDWLFPRLGLTQSGTVRLVDRLAEAGLAERGAPGGRRGIPLALTGPGRERLDHALAERAGALAAATAGLTPDEQDLLAGLAAKALAARPRDRSGADAACRLCDWPGCPRPCPVDASVTGTGQARGT
jgi:DNA-binding MarR family transcriptional regulator